MGWLKILALAAVLGFAAHWWKTHDMPDVQAASDNPNGFVPVTMPDGAGSEAVIILAPLNCPSEAAQRADALADRLTQLGIPNVRSAHYSARFIDGQDDAARQGSLAVLNGEIPAVFVHGMGKANPTAEEVAAEYERKK